MLTGQPFGAPYFVLYNQSGTNLSAATLTLQETRKIGALAIRGFIVDSKCYWFATRSEDEAHYLVGVLNSTVVNAAIKPWQTQGLMGERDIHRRPFEACNIPLFDPNKKRHQRIAGLAKECRARLLPVVPKMAGPVGKTRAEARTLLADVLDKLDGEVAALLKTSLPKPKTNPTTHGNQDTLFE